MTCNCQLHLNKNRTILFLIWFIYYNVSLSNLCFQIIKLKKYKNSFQLLEIEINVGFYKLIIYLYLTWG